MSKHARKLETYLEHLAIKFHTAATEAGEDLDAHMILSWEQEARDLLLTAFYQLPDAAREDDDVLAFMAGSEAAYMDAFEEAEPAAAALEDGYLKRFGPTEADDGVAARAEADGIDCAAEDGTGDDEDEDDEDDEDKA